MSHESPLTYAAHHMEWKAARAVAGATGAAALHGFAAQQRVGAAKIRLARTEQTELAKLRAHATFAAEHPELARAPRGASATTVSEPLRPLSFDDRSGNELRPATFTDMIGQDRLKRLMSRVIGNLQATGQPMDHMLIVGASGTGKTTIAQVAANELGRTVYQVSAPVDAGTFEQLRTTCQDGDVVIVDELHLQVQGDRRGITQAADPEMFFLAMEDRRIVSGGSMVPFPAVTFIGATTDAGLLPTPFLNRFPLQLTLDPYTVDDMTRMALANAKAIGMPIDQGAAVVLATAARRNPRMLNTYVRNARALGAAKLDVPTATEVICDLNGCTLDGLTASMQGMLRCLLNSRRESRSGEVVYQASVNTIATATGHGRDTKYVAIEVEPYLIAEGLVAVTHGGRQLTPAGVKRALAI